jgi:hypothetical protein
MARKPLSRPRATARTKRPPIAAVTTRLHLPRTWRVVTSRKLRASDADLARRGARREVPEIRLSGAWLERVGFPKGRRYLISVDRDIETIYLQAEPDKTKARRRREVSRPELPDEGVFVDSPVGRDVRKN